MHSIAPFDTRLRIVKRIFAMRKRFYKKFYRRTSDRVRENSEKSLRFCTFCKNLQSDLQKSKITVDERVGLRYAIIERQWGKG